MTETKTGLLSEAEARELIDEFFEGLVLTYERWQKIVETRAWLSVGYPDIATWWATELRSIDMRLYDARIANSALYEMFNDGRHSDFEISQMMNGIGPERVKAAHSSYNSSTPSEAAAASAPPRRRDTPVPPGHKEVTSIRPERYAPRQKLHIEFGQDECRWLKEMARIADIDLEERVREVVIRHFKRLEKKVAE